MNPKKRKPLDESFKEWLVEKVELEKLVAEKTAALVEKNRALEIEAALERVRTQTMAMHKSHELREVVSVMYEEMEALGLGKWGCQIMLCHKDKEVFELWLAEETGSNQKSNYFIKGKEHPVYRKIWMNWEHQTDAFTLHHRDEYKLAFDKYWIEETDFKHLPDEVKASVYDRNEVFLNYAPMKHGLLNAISYEKPFDNLLTILARFAKVFEQTYTRFLDLQKAEEQAREAQIETALERVRAKTMAMYKTEDLREVVGVLFEQMNHLHLADEGCNINIFKEDINAIETWMAGLNSASFPDCYYMEGQGHPFLQKQWDNWRTQAASFHISSAGKELAAYAKYIVEETDLKRIPEEIKAMMLSIPELHFSFITFKYGQLEIVNTVEPPSQENLLVLTRFAKVFEQTYTRFLDLQKAEGQAREAQIEAALERVRSRTMAMHKSEELSQVATAMFKEFQALKFINEVARTVININNEENGDCEMWITRLGGEEISANFKYNYLEHELWEKEYRTYQKVAKHKRKEHKYIVVHEGKAFEDLLAFAIEKKIAPPEEVKEIKELGIQKWIEHIVWFAYGSLVVARESPLSEDGFNILQRFTAVFEQTYTRFLDLQKAETQAREAQIETALERVRASTMAMHHSSDLTKSAAVLFEQIQLLGAKVFSSGFVLCEANNPLDEQWMSVGSSKELIQQYIPHEEERHHFNMYKAWQAGEALLAQKMEGEALQAAAAFLQAQPSVQKNLEKIIDKDTPFPSVQVLHAAYFSKGYLLIVTTEAFPEKDIFVRFAKVFEQTYTRFLDLQKAEEQAKEAQIEAALERVRAQTMAMHKSEELAKVAAAMFTEFQQLNLTNEFTRVVITIIKDEDNGDIESWITAMGGAEISTRFNFNYFDNEQLKAGYSMLIKIEKDKRKESKYTTIHKGKAWKDLLVFSKELKLVTPAEVKIVEEAGIEEWIEHSVGYAYGSLTIQRETPLSDQAFNILQRFAVVFEQTYTRFLDLQKAEEQARFAQIETSIERIRTKALAMHHSQEIQEVAKVIRGELRKLGIADILSTGIWIEHQKGKFRAWDISTIPETESQDFLLEFTYEIATAKRHPKAHFWNIMYQNKDYFTTQSDKATLYATFNWLAESDENSAKELIHLVDAGYLTHWWHAVAAFEKGVVVVDFKEEPPAEMATILPKMAAAFDLAYRRFEDLETAEAQKQKIEKVFNENQRLLHSILPKQIAEQIRAGQQTIVKRFEQVSILFADIVGFTILSEKLSPQKVVDILNGLFSKFDDLTDKYQLEKIKTIGDAYMVASGVPEEKDNHALAIFQFAQEMLQAIQQFNEVHNLSLAIRIGISSGPVVAGVIGKKKFAYDLWGDTVNTAARMEAYGQASCIQVAPPSYELLKEEFEFEKIPKVEIKGKGEMDVYVWTPPFTG